MLIRILLAIAIGAGGLRIYELSRQVSDLVSQNQDLEAQIQNLKADLLRAHVNQETAAMGQESAIDQLRARIQSQKDVLAAADQRLRKLRNDGGAGSQLGSLRDKLREESQLIGDLAQQLKDLRTRENQIRGEDKTFQQQGNAQTKETDQVLHAQVVEQQQLLQQLTTQLKRFKVNPWDSESQDAYNTLAAKVDAQRSLVHQLKEQRASNGPQWNQQRLQTLSQDQQTLSDLKASEQQVQAQLQRERAAQASLQHDIQAGVQGQNSQQALLQSAQADYDNQKAKLQDLENQLQAAQSQLQNFGETGAAPGAGGAGAEK